MLMKSPVALRVQRHRERKSVGKAVFHIEADELRLAEWLITCRLLDPNLSDCHEHIGAAFQQAMDLQLLKDNPNEIP